MAVVLSRHPSTHSRGGYTVTQTTGSGGSGGGHTNLYSSPGTTTTVHSGPGHTGRGNDYLVQGRAQSSPPGGRSPGEHSPGAPLSRQPSAHGGRGGGLVIHGAGGCQASPRHFAPRGARGSPGDAQRTAPRRGPPGASQSTLVPRTRNGERAARWRATGPPPEWLASDAPPIIDSNENTPRRNRPTAGRTKSKSRSRVSRSAYTSDTTGASQSSVKEEPRRRCCAVM